MLDFLLSMIGGLFKYLFLLFFPSLTYLFFIITVTFNNSFYNNFGNSFTLLNNCFESFNESLCLTNNVFLFGQKAIISVSTTLSYTVTSYYRLVFYFMVAIFSSILYQMNNFKITRQIFPFLIFFFLCFNGNPPRESKKYDLKCFPNSNQDLHDIEDKFEPFRKRDLHFLHINVNSLLSKIDELRDIVGHTKPAILGITESKLDGSVTNQEVHISGYNILRNDRNRNGGGVACYNRSDLCFNSRNIFSDSIEHIFFDLLIPKMKPTSIGIFYRPPNANNFLESINDLKQIDFKKSEAYFLGDFNINLLLNNKFVLKENQSVTFRNFNSPLVSKYKELCQTFSLKEIIQEPTRVTSTTFSLLDHILTNAGWKISQKGVIDVGLSDHQLIYCTRTILRTKFNMHNQIRVRSLKNYTPEFFREELTKINFPDYNIFSNVNIAYLDLVSKILSVVDKIAPFKDLRVKNKTRDWFDDEVTEAIQLREKRLKHFKYLCLHEELYKEAKYHVMKLMKEKKIQFYTDKLKENIGKPKQLWKALKSLGLPSKKRSISNICL